MFVDAKIKVRTASTQYQEVSQRFEHLKQLRASLWLMRVDNLPADQRIEMCETAEASVNDHISSITKLMFRYAVFAEPTLQQARQEIGIAAEILQGHIRQIRAEGKVTA